MKWLFCHAVKTLVTTSEDVSTTQVGLRGRGRRSYQFGAHNLVTWGTHVFSTVALQFPCFRSILKRKVRNARSDLMELAKVTTKGQVTIPIAIHKRLGIKDGDKLLFVEKSDGVVMVNPTMMALEKIGKVFEGEAERLGLESEDDVVAMIKEIRKENWKKNNAGDV